MAFVRTVKTASGATAVQIVHGKRRGVRRVEHVGSAHDERELEALKTAAAQRLAFLYPELGPPRKFRTSVMGLSYAANCSFRNSLWTSLGVR